MPELGTTLCPILKRLVEQHQTLNQIEAAELLASLLAEDDPPVAQVGALLAVLASRGATAHEIAGFAQAMQAASVNLPLDPTGREELVDTCGTGADTSGSFNISTGSALVGAAAGARVAKHGNRAITSGCGSADVLEALGIAVVLTPEEAAFHLCADRFAYLHAPIFHPRFRALGVIRRALGIRTIFHVVNPLANPGGVGRQVMGVYAPALVPVVAQAMVHLGRRHGLVVHGAGGMDEFSLAGASEVAEVRDGQVTRWTVTPEEVGLARAPLEALAGGSAAVNAAILRAVFGGERGPRRDVVVLNAGAVLLVARLVPTLEAGVRLAEVTIDRGAVTELVGRLAHTVTSSDSADDPQHAAATI